jgi:hypothetical protein
MVAVVAGLVALTGGSAAYALNTAATPHTGSTPTAGPAVTSAGGGFGGLPGLGGTAGRGGFGEGFGGRTGSLPAGGFPGGGSLPAGGLPSGGFPGGTVPGSGGTVPGSGGTALGSAGGAGASAALTALLKKTTTKWAAATVGSQSAAPLELASGKAIIAIGGFSGTDAAPTLAQFEALVAKGEVRYFIAGGFGGAGFGGGAGGGGNAITTWVAAHYTSTTVGGETVYDLTKATS